jgi:hypothetical protein
MKHHASLNVSIHNMLCSPNTTMWPSLGFAAHHIAVCPTCADIAGDRQSAKYLIILVSLIGEAFGVVGFASEQRKYPRPRPRQKQHAR